MECRVYQLEKFLIYEKYLQILVHDSPIRETNEKEEFFFSVEKLLHSIEYFFLLIGKSIVIKTGLLVTVWFWYCESYRSVYGDSLPRVQKP